MRPRLSVFRISMSSVPWTRSPVLSLVPINHLGNYNRIRKEMQWVYHLPMQHPAAERRISALEVLLGAFIVIGHNVWRILPNEVPILFVLFWISLRFHDGRWNVDGLRRSESR